MCPGGDHAKWMLARAKPARRNGVALRPPQDIGHGKICARRRVKLPHLSLAVVSAA
jgi:hypothetical protein